MRKAFVEALMRQDIAWFDKNPSGALSTKLFEYVVRHKTKSRKNCVKHKNGYKKCRVQKS